MNPGNIVIIYCSPCRCEHPEGRAKLIRLIEVTGIYEFWDVEFEDLPGKTYERMIKKT